MLVPSPTTRNEPVAAMQLAVMTIDTMGHYAHVPEPPGHDPDKTPDIPPPRRPEEDIDLPPREDTPPVRDPEQPRPN